MSMGPRSIQVTSDEYKQRVREAEECRAHFLKSTGLKVYSPSASNVLRVLMQGGKPVEQCKAVAIQVLDGAQEFGARGRGLFDHGEILGRDREPTRLMGYTYGVGPEDLDILAALRELGMTVYLSGVSNYGFWTIQVEIIAPGE